MVGHVERFNPAVQAIKDAIRGEDILSIAITRVGPFPPRMSNVGVVIDLAVHDIDLIRWFTDSDIVEVQPQLKSAVAEREDIALLQFRTASGVLAHINTNWLTPFKARTVHIATRNKYIMGDLLTRQVTECFGFQPDGSYSMRHLSVGHAEPLRAELLAFVEGDPRAADARGHRRGGRREPGDRDPLSARRCRRPAQAAQSRAKYDPKRAPVLDRSCSVTIFDRPMNQHTAHRPRPFRSSTSRRSAAGSAARIDDAIARVLDHCQFIMGPEVRALEPISSAFCGARHAITCASGTDALVLALMAKGDRPGRRGVLPGLHLHRDRRGRWRWSARRRCSPTSTETTFNLDPASLERAIATAKRLGLKPKAVIPVDLFGLPADYDAIGAIAQKHEPVRARRRRAGFRRDLATARSARSRDVTATSFFPAKPLGCYGDGGAVLTDDDELAGADPQPARPRRRAATSTTTCASA